MAENQINNGRYDNYIFDLYGTLIDIHTDEENPEVWKQVAAMYRVYGAVYTPAGLHRAYLKFVHEAERKMRREAGHPNIEICLDDVFVRLLREAPEKIDIAHRVDGRLFAELSDAQLQSCGWIYDIACAFRSLSRTRLRAYPGICETLADLKSRGKKVYLLSNAQGIYTRPEIEQVGLMPYFDDIFISSEHGVRKPDPGFLRELMEKHRMDPARTIYTGNDVHDDVGVAFSCGLHCNLYNPYGLSAREQRRQIEEMVRRFPGTSLDMVHLQPKAGKILE